MSRPLIDWQLLLCVVVVAFLPRTSVFAQLHPATPSFSAISDEGLYTYTFGTFRQDAAGATNNFSIFNRAASSGTTSPLSLVGVSSLGYDNAMELQTGTIVGLAAGGQAPLQLVLNTAQSGNLSVSYVLEFKSDSLPSSPHKFVAINGYAIILRHGDFDGDGDVDNADYMFWRSTVGTNNAATDGNNNGIVDAADFVIWRKNFTGPIENSGASGMGSLTGSAVPEPATVLSSLWIAVLIAISRRRRTY